MMGHCISAAILKDDFDTEIAKDYDLWGIALGFDLTMFPLSHYYTDYWGKLLNISGVLSGERPRNLIFPNEAIVAHLMMKITDRLEPVFAIIETDYFGGFVSQWALVYRGVLLADDQIKQISSALKKFLGVRCRAGMDEFDTVGLANYRSLPEYLEKYMDLAE